MLNIMLVWKSSSYEYIRRYTRKTEYWENRFLFCSYFIWIDIWYWWLCWTLDPDLRSEIRIRDRNLITLIEKPFYFLTSNYRGGLKAFRIRTDPYSDFYKDPGQSSILVHRAANFRGRQNFKHEKDIFPTL